MHGLVSVTSLIKWLHKNILWGRCCGIGGKGY